MKKSILVLAVVMALGLGLVPAQAATVNVVIAGFQYAPSGFVTTNPLPPPGGPQAVPGAPVVHATDTLVFTSLDALPHTVTKDTGPALGTWPSKNFSGAGTTASIPLAGFPNGTYTYKCTFHSGMKGSFIVS